MKFVPLAMFFVCLICAAVNAPYWPKASNVFACGFALGCALGCLCLAFATFLD